MFGHVSVFLLAAWYGNQVGDGLRWEKVRWEKVRWEKGI
jgi:hypothetical protein